MRIEHMYKIHGLSTAQGTRHSTNSGKFYTTYSDALAAATKCFSRGDCEGIVIYKAIKLVMPAKVPLMITDIVDDSEDSHGGD